MDLEAHVAGLPCWRGKVKLEPLEGGLSNTAFIVDDETGRYVARCGGDIPVHHVFRDRERAASVAAHAAGLAPELVYAEPGVMVIRHIDGRTLTEADLPTNSSASSGSSRHVTASCRAIWRGRQTRSGSFTSSATTCGR
jgi:hypothetical protein